MPMIVHVNKHVHNDAKSTCSDECPKEDSSIVHAELLIGHLGWYGRDDTPQDDLVMMASR